MQDEWIWRMEYLRKRRLPAAVPELWEKSKKAYLSYKKQKESEQELMSFIVHLQTQEPNMKNPTKALDAKSKDTSPVILEQLLQDDDPNIVALAAMNPNTPKDLWIQLCHSQ